MDTKKFLHQAFVQNARKYVEKTLEKAYIEAKMQSPVKTGKYQSGIYKTGIEESPEMIHASIRNDVDYALFVEEGWRARPVNWHLANGSIYRATGAKVFEKLWKQLQNNTL